MTEQKQISYCVESRNVRESRTTKESAFKLANEWIRLYGAARVIEETTWKEREYTYTRRECVFPLSIKSPETS